MMRHLLGAFLLVGAAGGAARAQEATKIGYVDMQRALGETEDGRKAKADLKKVFDQKQKELDEQQENLKKAMDDLNKKRTLLPVEKVREKEGELQNEVQKVQQTFMRHQQDLAQREQEVTGRIFERMQRIIGRMASTEAFTMVFDRNQAGLVFAKPHLDLTNELIRRYNAGEGADGKKPAAPAGAPAKGAKK